MIRKLWILGILGFLLFQCASSPKVKSIRNGVFVSGANFSVKVQFIKDNIVHVEKAPLGNFPKKKSLIVVHKEIASLPISVQEKRNTIWLSSSRLKIKISKGPGRVEYFTPEGKSILKEKGKPQFTPFEDAFEKAFHVEQKFYLSREEGIYGLGQHQDGIMNYRGHTVTLVQSNTEAAIPFLVSTKGYGILWDNYSKTVFRDTPIEASFWSDVGDGVDYYFVFGNSMDKTIQGYRDLTGQAPLYGKWAYGYWQSKEHYHTQEEVLNVAREYRLREIPIDNIIQDWNYWPGSPYWGGMIFDPERYPRPEEMVSQLHQMHYHLMISIWPALGPASAIYKEMAEKGYLYAPVGWGGFKYYDAFNPDANQVYFKYLKHGLLSKGIDAWWIDSTEPDVINALTKASSEYELKRMGRHSLGSWARYLNVYSLSMTDALYKMLRHENPGKRVYILTRSTFAGQQRNAATTWSGDIGASWEIFRKQISAGLNHCMAGVPYWTFDIGGFVIGAYGGLFHRGGKDPAYQELYTRMFQFGTFCPIFRAHGSETPREIWEFGEFVSILVKFTHLRYRLLPYIYSLAWQVTQNGYTYFRGLPMDFPEDRNTYGIDDQFLFGPAFLVCPVTEYQLYRPPEPSVLVSPRHFVTPEGKPGLKAKYYRDSEYRILTHEQIDPCIDIYWYTGRPAYVTDSTFSIRWEGKLIPTETGPHQFHLKSFDAKRIYLDGRKLSFVYTSVEQYTEVVDLEKGKEYDFVLETENRSTGAARMQLFWKTPSIFAKEKENPIRSKGRVVYLPSGVAWVDFWNGKTILGGKQIFVEAPIEKMPIFVKAGSIVPMGPFVQYATEKPADPMELRIYPGADGQLTLYEDENEGYNYEKGIYSTIDLSWNDKDRILEIGERKGEFPGMLNTRTFHIVLVKENHGTGVEITRNPDRVVVFQGKRMEIQF